MQPASPAVSALAAPDATASGTTTAAAPTAATAVACGAAATAAAAVAAPFTHTLLASPFLHTHPYLLRTPRLTLLLTTHSQPSLSLTTPAPSALPAPPLLSNPYLLTFPPTPNPSLQTTCLYYHVLSCLNTPSTPPYNHSSLTIHSRSILLPYQSPSIPHSPHLPIRFICP
ncbi:unnamed protein product [Closterium sp. NIES-54]